MRACSLGLVGLGFRVRYIVRVIVRDTVGVMVSDGVRVSTFYFSSHQQLAESSISAGPHFTYNHSWLPVNSSQVSTHKQCSTRRLS